jgi:hypothetical protein
MERMRSTLFCLVLPGDSASARRTSEIFMSGCIPVFLGPPFGSMPLAHEGGIDYRASSLFFNVTEYRCVATLPYNANIFIHWKIWLGQHDTSGIVDRIFLVSVTADLSFLYLLLADSGWYKHMCSIPQEAVH